MGGRGASSGAGRLTSGGKGGVIENINNGMAVDGVYYIGRIDINIYSCITKDIVTDEVIITDNRINHIIERRGKEFYDRYYNSFAQIIADPDYIFKDLGEDSALVCKRFAQDGKIINIVLKFAVERDNRNYKNSIITAIGESEKRFAQRLRNNSPVYVRKNLDK